jgi:predicted dithiol-disulfide oxidoreductase (DUF899 family)
MIGHNVGTREQWLAARLDLLDGKELTRRSDELARQRRELPWVPLGSEYVFQTDDGEKTLRELFAGRSQLLVHHFMFGPDWTEGRAARAARCVQAPHGLDLPMGVVTAK